jgi:hypothetical protein
MNVLKQVKELSLLTLKVFKQDHRLPIGLVVSGLCMSPMIIFEVYLMSWLFGFLDSEKGPVFKSEDIIKLY